MLHTREYEGEKDMSMLKEEQKERETEVREP